MGWDLDGFATSLLSVSLSTVTAYRSDVAGFADWASRLGVDDPAEVERTTLRRYLAYLSTRRYSRRTVARKACSLRRYFGWLSSSGALDADPSVGLTAPRGEPRLPRVLRTRELSALLDEPRPAVEDDPEAVRLRDDAVLELLYGSGLRVSEVCGLTPDDVDLVRSEVTVWGKGDKQRRVPMHRICVRALAAWMARGRASMTTVPSRSVRRRT